MKLNEKIFTCRRKAGLSQEALAEKLGVSRQAISKWETGEASPEITKLPLLARAFGVTADWLLSEDGPEEDAAPEAEPAPEPASHGSAPEPAPARAVPEWVDRLPGFLGRMIRRYGWLVGLRIAIGGALFTAMGLVGRAMFSSMNDLAGQQMNAVLGGMGGGAVFYDSAGSMMDAGSLLGMSTASMSNPADILCSFITGLGLVMLVGGGLLAWVLKKKGMEK